MAGSLGVPRAEGTSNTPHTRQCAIGFLCHMLALLFTFVSTFLVISILQLSKQRLRDERGHFPKVRGSLMLESTLDSRTLEPAWRACWKPSFVSEVVLELHTLG